MGLGARPKLLPFEGANVVEGCIAVDDKMCTSVDDILAGVCGMLDARFFPKYVFSKITAV